VAGLFILCISPMTVSTKAKGSTMAFIAGVFPAETDGAPFKVRQASSRKQASSLNLQPLCQHTGITHLRLSWRRAPYRNQRAREEYSPPRA